MKIHREHQVQIRDAVSTLSDMPDVGNVKKLVHHDYGYRMRVGHYRILFDWEGILKVVSIQEVKKAR
nr:type II toxin-antitoxin system RelE/ParE family toxin [Pseudomonas gingeri]